MFKSVLLPIDTNHSASWEKALPLAGDQLAPGGTLHLLSIVHDFGGAMVESMLPDGFAANALNHMEQTLEAFAAEKVGNRLPCKVHIGHGHVPETILKAAEAVAADLIVMSSHPPDDLRSLLVGSYADKVVRHAKIPVLVVR